MGEGYRELPAHIETMLSPRDAKLNRLPVDKLLESHRRNEVRVFVDRGLAIQAASSGVPTSGLTTLLSLLFPFFLLAAPLAWYFSSWVYALAAVVLAVMVFRASRALIVARVREYALNNPKMLDLLISKGTIWFERVTDEPKGLRPTTVSDTDNPTFPHREETLSPEEQIFGTDSTAPDYFDLPSEHNGWHDVLDGMVTKLKPAISKIFPNEADGFVEAKCELIGYAAAYEAKLWSGAEIPKVVWNTLVSSIENRIFGRIGFKPNLSGYREHADGSQEFISYSSEYVTHMHDIERIVDHQYQAEIYDFKKLLSVLSPKKDFLTEDAVVEFSHIFKRAVILCSGELIPTLEDFV